MTTSKPKDKIRSYQALRGIASVFILFSHMHYLSEATNPFWHTFWSVFMSRCAVCTTFFFLCSGFFLDYTWKALDFGKYVKSKLKRLYPITLIVFLLALAVSIAMPDETVQTGSGLWFFNIAANLFLFKSLIPAEAVFYSFHGPSWYISALFLMYLLLFPLIKRLHGEESEKWRRYIGYICLAAYAAELIVCIAVQAADLPSSLYLCYVNPWFRVFGEGLAGVLLCQYIPQIQKKLEKLPATGLEIAAMVILISDILLRSVVKFTGYAAWIQLIPMGLLLIAFRRGTGAVSAVLNTKPFQFLGDISFELYMTHAFVYEGLPVAAGIVCSPVRAFLLQHPGSRFVITLILCLLFAWIVHLLMNMLNQKVISKL